MADVRLHFSNGDYPDGNPAFGCNEGLSVDCVATRNSGSYWSAIDGRKEALESFAVTDYERFNFVYLQLTLDDAYADIAAVSMWFTSALAV